MERGFFPKLAEIRKRKEAAGEEVIDLSIGAPNIPPAPHVMRALCEAAADPANYVYAISDKRELLGAVAAWYKRRYGVELDPGAGDLLPLRLPGGDFPTLRSPSRIRGDVVLAPDPCYPVFADGPRIAGADIYYMTQKKENGWVIRLSDIPEDVARRAKLMVVSYPNNPTAVMAPESFYEELVAFARKYDVIVLHDNAYSELVFDGKTCGSFLAYPGAKEVGVEFNSLSKTYGLAGARIGFCLGNARVVAKLKLLKSNMDYGMFLPLQRAAIAAITGDQSCVASTRRAYEERRNALCDGFTSIGWRMDRPAATMFVWAAIPAAYKSSEDFAMDLVEKAGVLVTPGSAFGPSGEGYVRLALVQDREALDRAIEAVKRSGVLG